MTTNLDLARKVGKHVTLHAVTLRSANAEAFLDPLAVPKHIGMVQGYRCSHEIGRFNEERKKLTVTIDFRFDAKDASEEAAEEDLLALSASFGLVYSLAGDLEIEDECFVHFADVNGPYNAWPYWREFVQSVTGRVGLAGVMVPMFRPVAKRVEEPMAIPKTKGEQALPRRKK